MMASRSWALNASAIAFNVATEADFWLAMPVDPGRSNDALGICHQQAHASRTWPYRHAETVACEQLAERCRRKAKLLIAADTDRPLTVPSFVKYVVDDDCVALGLKEACEDAIGVATNRDEPCRAGWQDRVVPECGHEPAT
jgi:hypothetical protein